MFPNKASILIQFYPILIAQSRYGGIYEGGEWFCIPNCENIPEDAVGEDCDCVDFWASEVATKIGVGDTPDSALLSMLEKNSSHQISDEYDSQPLYSEILKEFRNPEKEHTASPQSSNIFSSTQIERTDYFKRASGFAPDGD
jgi:hypothetical protein